MDVSTNVTADDARRARELEYGQFVATEAISLDGAPAFNEGDPVPAGHVKKFHLQAAVKKVDEPKASAEK